MPAVSVIATVLNERENIPRLVASLLHQEPPAEEIVIVDGGSSDGTWEWLRDAADSSPRLRPIRDPTCNLSFTPGPIARGRNTAIAAARSNLIACADAGCAYPPYWLAELSAPLRDGSHTYVLGGSCLDLRDATVWDLASAPFLGVKLSPDTPSKSCTARSMAFTRELWQSVGGFPETVLFGEDTLFDLEARRRAQPAFPRRAKAFYRPQNSLRTACRQIGLYAASDGILGVRGARLWRNATRCALEAAALALLPWTWIPSALVLGMILHLAFSPDGLLRRASRPQALAARIAFAALVPWIITVYRIRGGVTKKSPGNTQNVGA